MSEQTTISAEKLEELNQYMGFADDREAPWGTAKDKQAALDMLYALTPTEAPEGAKYQISYMHYGDDEQQVKAFSNAKELQDFVRQQMQASGDMPHNFSLTEFDEDGKAVSSNMVFGSAARMEQTLSDLANAPEGQLNATMQHHSAGSVADAEARLAAWDALPKEQQEALMKANQAGAGITMDHVMAIGSVDEAIAAQKDGRLAEAVREKAAAVDSFSTQKASVINGAKEVTGSDVAGVSVQGAEAQNTNQEMANLVDPSTMPNLSFDDPGLSNGETPEGVQSVVGAAVPSPAVRGFS